MFAALLGPFGCVDSSEAPPPPPTVDGSTDGFVRPPVGPGQDQGHPSDGGGDGGGVGCLNDPQDVRVLFVLDRSDTMAEFTTGGDGAALNVVASTAAADLIASLPDTSQAGLLLFPSQTFDEPDCPGVDALAEPAIRSAPYLKREPAAGACLARIFFDKANSNLTRLWEYGGNSLLVPVVSEELLRIEFVTVQDNRSHQAEVPVGSTYVRHRTPECNPNQSG